MTDSTVEPALRKDTFMHVSVPLELEATWIESMSTVKVTGWDGTYPLLRVSLAVDRAVELVTGLTTALTSAGSVAGADALYRLAASLMVAADELDTVNAGKAQQPLVGVGVPH